MNSQPSIEQAADLLISIRHARRAFVHSGRPRGHWDAMADGIRRDFRAGVPLPQIARTVEAWAALISYKYRPSAGKRRLING
jgi:hypothetical protein